MILDHLDGDRGQSGIAPLACVSGSPRFPLHPRDTYLMLREERKALFRYSPGLLGNQRERFKRVNNAHEESSYLRPGLVFVSDALVIGVLTLVLSITVDSENKRK